MNWVSENLGWLIGTKAHCIKKREANRPKQQKNENDVEYAKTLITYEDNFNRSYRYRSYIKRTLLCILIIMLFTNPTLEEFTYYQQHEYEMPADQCHKKGDYLFFSTYSASGHTFIGALTTFFLVGPGEHAINRVVHKQDSVYYDPTAHVDTFKKLPPLNMPALDTGATHNAARMDSIIRENNKPNPFAQPETPIKF